jgi:hypothetical protein
MRSSNGEVQKEPSNKHAAPMELDEKPGGVGGYRNGAPTELLEMVHGQCMRDVK